MSRVFEIYLDEAVSLRERLRSLDEILGELADEIRKDLPDARIYLFGSYARGTPTATSDIDILVVTEAKERLDASRLKSKNKKRSQGIPLELHITGPREYRKWYSRFIPRGELIEIKSDDQE